MYEEGLLEILQKLLRSKKTEQSRKKNPIKIEIDLYTRKGNYRYEINYSDLKKKLIRISPREGVTGWRQKELTERPGGCGGGGFPSVCQGEL